MQNNTQPVSVSPLAMIFAGEAVGNTSKAQTVVFTNDESTSLTISKVALAGTNSGDFSEERMRKQLADGCQLHSDHHLQTNSHRHSDSDCVYYRWRGHANRLVVRHGQVAKWNNETSEGKYTGTAS